MGTSTPVFMHDHTADTRELHRHKGTSINMWTPIALSVRNLLAGSQSGLQLYDYLLK